MTFVNLAEAAHLLRLHCEEWDDASLADLAVFGSVARGEAHEGSDVDVLLTFRREVGLLTLARLKLAFEDVLGRRVDVVTPGGLKAPLRAEVLADAVNVFGEAARLPVQPRRKRWRWRVEEMLACLRRVEKYTANLSFASFQESELVQDAVLLNLLRIGESVAYLPEEVRALHPEVPWEQLRQVRHLIAHDYFGLDLNLLWFTLQHELPPLAPLLAHIAQQQTALKVGRPEHS